MLSGKSWPFCLGLNVLIEVRDLKQFKCYIFHTSAGKSLTKFDNTRFVYKDFD